MIIENDLKTVAFKYISGLVHLIDIAIFKITIDYIVRNFDPTGINIGGLIDSFYYVLMKPKLSSFSKMFQRGINNYREFVKLRKLSLKRNLYHTKVLCCGIDA